MGLKLFKRSQATGKTQEVSMDVFLGAALEFQVRDLCFWACVNLMANALGRCEIRTFREGKEIREREWWMWNREPNVNQNASTFWHKAMAKMAEDGEALIVPVRKRSGLDSVVVADSWQEPEYSPTRQNTYRGVTVEGYTFDRSFPESEVLHLTLDAAGMGRVVTAMYQSYAKMVDAAVSSYTWDRTQHWKVKVENVSEGDPDWQRNFAAMLQEQLKPFFDSKGAILPEFAGYQYEKVNGKESGDSRDIRSMVDDILDFTATGFGIPPVLLRGQVEGIESARTTFLTRIDAICDQIGEEINRKRYGFELVRAGAYVKMDSSAIQHFDAFANAANVEKLVGSGAYTINDVLRAAGQPEIREAWASRHWMTKNIAGIETSMQEIGGQA